MDTDLQGVQSTIGYCLLKDHHYNEAVQAYQKAISDNTKRTAPLLYDSGEDHYYLGEALLEAGDKTNARLEWRKTIMLTSDHRITSEAKASIASIN